MDGTTFTDVGTVSESSALLLANNAELRYVPDSKNGETPTITYRAWDTTGGANGVTDDLTLSGLVGDSGPFSTATDTASLTVTSVNDAPVLTPASPSLGTATSDATATTISLAKFINNGAGTTTITDVDNGAVVGGIALTGTTGNGTWAYSLDGTTFTAVGTVADTSALLLPSTATLQYTPASHGHRNGDDYLPGMGYDHRAKWHRGRHDNQRRHHRLQHRYRHGFADHHQRKPLGLRLSRREQRWAAG